MKKYLEVGICVWAVKRFAWSVGRGGKHKINGRWAEFSQKESPEAFNYWTFLFV